MPVGQRVVSACRFEAITSQTFQRESRLTHKQEYDRVLKSRSAIRLRGGCFRVLAIDRTNGPARLGLIVGKRQLRQAVARNGVKRIVRESFRKSRLDLPGLDIVFQLLDRPDAHFERDVLAVWSRLGQSGGNNA